MNGKFPISKDECRDLGAIQMQITFGDHNPKMHVIGFLKMDDFLPPMWRKDKKEMEKSILAEHKKLVGLTEINAKLRYVQVIRSLKTFGITTFNCKEKGELRNKKNKGKWMPIVIGITKEKILRLDTDDMSVVKDSPLTHLKRWAAKPGTFTFDFGEYDDGYYQVQTNDAEAISSLIAGYIDIILKSRRDAIKASVEDSAETAVVDNLAHATGVATATTTTAYTPSMAMQNSGTIVMSGPKGVQYQPINATQMQNANALRKEIPPSQRINVVDLSSAQKAVLLLTDELEKEEDGPALEEYNTTMTIDQIKTGIGASATRIDQNIMQLLSATEQPMIDARVLNANAKTITQDVLKLAGMARSAAAIGGYNDQDVVTGAKQVSGAIAKLLDATQRVTLSPQDPVARAALVSANREVREAMVLLNSAKEGRLNDKAAEELTFTLANEVNIDLTEVGQYAVAIAHMVPDPVRQQYIMQSVNQLTSSQAAFMQTAKLLSSAVLDPAARTNLLTATNDLAQITNGLVTQLRDAGAPPEYIQAVNYAAQHLNDSIKKMVGAIDTAESRSGDIDFSTPQFNVVSAIAAIREADNSGKMLDGIKVAVANVNEMMNYAKMVADTSDAAGKTRLNATITSMKDSVAKLIMAAKDVAARPDDPAAQGRLAEATSRIEQTMQEIVTDAGAVAATASLRSKAKETTAAAYKITRTLEDILRSVNDPALQTQLQQQIIQTNEAVAGLMENIKKAAKEPQNSDAQVKLLQAAQRALVPISQAVATSKRVAPGLQDVNQRQALNYAATTLSDGLQKLMGAIKQVSDIDSHQDMEEAIQQFDATNADIEAAEFAAQTGYLTALPGQTREDGIALLDLNARTVAEAADDVTGIAKDPKGRKLGDAAKKLAAASAQVVAAIKTVAATTKDKTTQKNVLQQAKKFNREVAGILTAARAVSSRRDDAGLNSALTNSRLAVKTALSSLNSAARGLDAREADEALEAINRESTNKLQPVQASGQGGAEFRNSAESMISVSKALNASLQQLAAVARANPRAMGAAARLVSSTVQKFIADSQAAAAYSANQETADAIIRSARDLADRTVNVINKAKEAAANKDAESLKALQDSLGDVARAIEAVQTQGSHPELDRAINRCLELSVMFDQPPQVHPMTTQQVLATLDEASQSLAASIASLVSAARMNSGKLGLFAKDATAKVEAIVAASLAAANPAPESAGVLLSQPGQAIITSVTEIMQAPQDTTRAVAAAKSVAANASKLIGSAKNTAAKLTDKVAQAALLKIAHAFATSTSKLARAAQMQPSPEQAQQLYEAANELHQRVYEIEQATQPQGAVTEVTVDPAVAAQLAQASRMAVMAVGQALRASVGVASDPANDALSSDLSTASKAVTETLSDLLRVAQAFNPGKVQLDQTSQTLQSALADLDSAAIQMSVGMINHPQAYAKSHQDWQEDLVNCSRDLASDISALVDGSRQDPAALRSAGLDVQKSIPVLVNAAKAAAATTADPNLQRDLLLLSKDLADSMLGLVRAAREATPNNRTSQQNLVERSKKASQAIGRLVSTLKANVVIMQEMDEAIGSIQRATATVDQPSQPSGSDYSVIRDGIMSVVTSVVEACSNINSADKSNLGQISLQAKQLADQWTGFVTKIRDAVATTPDPNAKRDMPQLLKIFANAASSVIDSAKKFDPRNPQTEQVIAQSFAGASKAASDLLKAVRRGNVAEIAVDNALELIKQQATLLNNSIIFAQANQLEPTADAATVSVGGAQQAVSSTAQGVSQQLGALAQAAQSGNQVAYANASAGLANSIKHLAEATIRIASKVPDSTSQQNILTAGKAVAITGQQAIIAGREVQRKPTDTTYQALSAAYESGNAALAQLTEVAGSAIGDLAASEKALEQAKIEISAAMMGQEVDNDATPADLVAVAKQLTQSVSEIAFAQNADAASSAVQTAVEGIRRLFPATRGAGRLTPNPALKAGLVTGATKIAGCITDLLENAKLNRSDDVAMAKIESSAMNTTASIGEYVRIVNQLPNANNLQVEELSGNVSSLADQEMDKTAQLILQAVQALDYARASAQQRPQQARATATSQKELDRMIRQGQVAEQVIGAAREIAEATSHLVNAAYHCQHERKNNAQVGMRYRNDPMWNNGLISAARVVSDSITRMVQEANSVLAGKTQEEALIVAAKMIAASTAQLVTASKVRGAPGNPQMQSALTQAAKSVATSTGKFLVAARRAGEEEEEQKAEDEGGVSEHGSKIKEFEEQMKILKLEKELMSARKNLGNIRRTAYQ
jgi:talin